MMAISLRIVGLFYFRDDIPDNVGTVGGALKWAQDNPRPGVPQPEAERFRFLESARSVQAFYAYYPEGTSSLTTDTKYRAGEFYLPESLVETPDYSIWQYYVFEGNIEASKPEAVYVPRPPVPNRIQSFKEATVPAGGSIVWRLVSILGGPTGLPAVLRGPLNAPDPTPPPPAIDQVAMFKSGV